MQVAVLHRQRRPRCLHVGDDVVRVAAEQDGVEPHAVLLAVDLADDVGILPQDRRQVEGEAEIGAAPLAQDARRKSVAEQ